MKQEYDKLLKQALTPSDEPDYWLNQKILRQVREEKRVTNKIYRKIPAVVLTMVLILGIGSLTTFAMWKYLMPNEIAKVMQDKKLADAFMGEDAILVNETQSYGDYHVTFLGIVSGKELTDWSGINDNGTIRSDSSHLVVAIENTDGTPMPDIAEDAYGELEFLVTPLIEGYNPADYNAFAFGGSYTDEVIDGVLYRIMDCDNVEMFAEHKLYLAVLDSTFYRTNAYCYNEENGEISRNQNYDGLNALFQLPIDVEKADSAAAKIYMEGLFNEDVSDADGEMSGIEESAEIDEWIAKLTPENIEEMAELVEHTVQVLVVDEDGMINVKPYEIEGRGASGTCSISVSWAFGNTDYGMLDKFCFAHSGTLDTLRVETFTKNENGTYTFAVYIPKE